MSGCTVPPFRTGMMTSSAMRFNETLAGKKLNLNGKPLNSLPNANTTPLLYDSTNLNKNAHDAAEPAHTRTARRAQ